MMNTTNTLAQSQIMMIDPVIEAELRRIANDAEHAYIEVYHAEKVDGVKTQRIRIHYACVGSIEVPEVLQLAQPQVLLQTRKGVAISYSDSQKVVNL